MSVNHVHNILTTVNHDTKSNWRMKGKKMMMRKLSCFIIQAKWCWCWSCFTMNQLKSSCVSTELVNLLFMNENVVFRKSLSIRDFPVISLFIIMVNWWEAICLLFLFHYYIDHVNKPLNHLPVWVIELIKVLHLIIISIDEIILGHIFGCKLIRESIFLVNNWH